MIGVDSLDTLAAPNTQEEEKGSQDRRDRASFPLT
jgi:hypothetical protein